MNLSEKTIAIVKATAPILAERGEAITRRFYQQLFKHNPELLNIFNITNQRTGRQQAALAGAVYAYAANIDNLGTLTKTIQRIAHKHVSLNIQPEHYPVVGHHLLKAMADVLEDAATDEILSSWQEAYSYLSQLFIEIEEGLYQKHQQAEGGWRGTREFQVVNKVQESDLITSFYFEPVDGLAVKAYHPGQYIGIYLHPEHSKYQCIRQYSLSDAPNGRSYRISVKREGECETMGMVSHYLHDSVEKGHIVRLSPPCGDFCLDCSSDSPLILLSGGVGQTPMLSMLNSLAGKNHQREVIYVHSALNGKVHAFGQHVRELAEQNSNIDQILFYDQPTTHCFDHHYNGKTNLQLIRERIDLPAAQFYFCGPLGYMVMVKETLQDWGVAEERIHYEVFGPHREL